MPPNIIKHNARAVISCPTCHRSCIPHVSQKLGSQTLRTEMEFCSEVCRDEWVKNNTRIDIVFLGKQINCWGCGKSINAHQHSYWVIEAPLQSMMGVPYCSPDCAHETVDKACRCASSVIKRNILPIRALEFVALTNSMNDPDIYHKLAEFEDKPVDWFLENPLGTLTAPVRPRLSSSCWTKTVEYLELFLSFCLNYETD